MFDHEKKLREIAEKACYQKKQELIREILDCVEYYCDKNHITYVALGSLVSLAIEEKTIDQVANDFRIGMLAQDYKKFLKAFLKDKKYADIHLKCKGYITLKREYISLEKKGHFESEYGAGDVTVTFALEPLSWLPEDYTARQEYLKNISTKYSLLRQQFNTKERMAEKVLHDKSRRIINDKLEISTVLKGIPGISIYKDTSILGRIEQKVGNLYQAKDIFPAGKAEFCGGSIRIPANPQKMKALNSQETITYFEEEWKKILKAMNDFCQKEGISYFAIRDLLKIVQNGEDVYKDELNSPAIGLLREDYEKLLKLLKYSKNPLIFMDWDESFPQISSLQNKLCLRDSKPLVLDGITASIDLVVYDRLPDCYEEGFTHKEKIRKIISNCNRSSKIQKNLVYFRKEYDSVESQIEKTHKTAMSHDKDAENPNARIFSPVTERGKNIPLNEVFPLHKGLWDDVEISLPYNPYLWAIKKEKGYTRYLTEGKCEVLKRIDQLCHEQNIPYFATAKLLIGAKVYHDVIPGGGEDSFSIGLIRKDYETFLDYLRKHGEEYGIQLNESRDGEGKVPLITKHITLTNRGNGPMMVRLHPYDKVPLSFYTRNDFLEKIKQMNSEYEELINFKYNMISKYKEIYIEEEIKEKKAYYKDMDIMECAAKIDAYAQKYNDDPEPQGYQRVAFDFSGKVVSYDNISHAERIQFAEIEIDCLKDITPWYQPMDEELRVQIDTIQKANIVLMKEFDRVCQELGIGYFICAGTLLGYMRHHGFIPWDDDVDVGMLREDYDKLLELGPKYFGEDFFLQTRESDKNIPYVYSKLRLNHTEYFTDFTYDRDMHKGVGMDIFPFDYVPNDMKKRAAMIEEATKRAKYHNLVVRNQYPDKPVPFAPRNEEEKQIEKEQKEMISKYWSMSLKDTQNSYLEEATKCNIIGKKEKYTTVASFVIGYTCLDLEDILPYERDTFEGIEVSVPRNPIPLMQMQYGDYMQMPLTHQRVSHKVVKWSIDDEIRQRYNIE